MQINTYIEIQITVEFDYFPPSRGHRDRYGAPEEPDVPAEVEITSVKDVNGVELQLDESRLDSIKTEIWEWIADHKREAEPPEPLD